MLSLPERRQQSEMHFDEIKTGKQSPKKDPPPAQRPTSEEDFRGWRHSWGPPRGAWAQDRPHGPL